MVVFHFLSFSKALLSLLIQRTVYFDYFKVVDRTLPHSLSQLHNIPIMDIVLCIQPVLYS